MQEIEVKYKLESFEVDKIKELLKLKGAKFIRVSHEKNFVIVHNKKKFWRVRDDNGKFILTYKGKKLKSKYKSRKEYNWNIPKFIASLLLMLFKTKSYYNKIRETYHLNPANEICIDKLPKIGYFLELEATSEKSLQEVIDILNLKKEIITKSYYKLINEV